MNDECPIANGYELRKFREEDLNKVVLINRLCLPENYTPSFFLELYRSHPDTFLIAEHENNVIGYIVCRIEAGFSTVKRFKFTRKGHVVSVAVLPEHRLKGLGIAMMIAVMKGMTCYDCGETFLEVRTSNTSAISLYNKLGYKSTRKMAGYYIDGEEASIMSRKLPFKPEECNLSKKPQP